MGNISRVEKFSVQTRVTPQLPQGVLGGRCFKGRWGNCGGEIGYASLFGVVLCSKHAASARIILLEVASGATEGTTEWEITRWDSIPSIGAQIRGILEGHGNLPLRCPDCGKEIPSSKSSNNPQDGPPELHFFCPEGHRFTVAVGEKVRVQA